MLWTIFIFNKSKISQKDIKTTRYQRWYQRYQVVYCYDVSKTSVSLRYQLVRRYDVPNWSVLFTYQWDVADTSEIGPSTSQIGPSYWRPSSDVMMMSQPGHGRSNWSLKWVSFFWVLCSMIFQGLRWFSLFKVPASMSLQRLKDIQLWRLCNVLSSSVSLRYQLVRRYDVSNWSVFLRINETLQ